MRLRNFFIVGTWLVQSSFAAATIEGQLNLPEPKAATPPASSGRYQIKASSAPAAPEPVQAVVYLEGDFAKAPPTTNVVVEMGQKKFQFQHTILPVQKGTRIQFPNHDEDYHNVFSYSKPKRFDLGRYRKDEIPPAQLFDKPGAVKLFCEIHEHMRATILVLDTPHFARVNPDGSFKLPDLPAGKYTLKVWLDEKTVLEKPVELKDGETLKVDFAT
jgi:plastocyanin